MVTLTPYRRQRPAELDRMVCFIEDRIVQQGLFPSLIKTKQDSNPKGEKRTSFCRQKATGSAIIDTDVIVLSWRYNEAEIRITDPNGYSKSDLLALKGIVGDLKKELERRHVTVRVFPSDDPENASTDASSAGEDTYPDRDPLLAEERY